METTLNERPMYGALPYDMIVDKWNEVYYSGNEPSVADSATRTFELCMALRNIAGNDPQLLARIIPTYEGMTEEMKAKMIREAVNSKQTQMPSRLREVLTKLYADNFDNKGINNAIEEIQYEDSLLYNNRIKLKKLPMGIKESAKKVGEQSLMPMILFICTIIGALATNVRLRIDGIYNWLNILVLIVGEAGSNKSLLIALYQIWVAQLKAEDAMLEEMEREYDEQYRMKKNSKEQPKKPKLPYRLIPLNNTPACVADMLNEIENDEHALSVSDEIDEINAKWRGADKVMLSVMWRKSYDAGEFYKKAKSPEAAKCHREHLKWNVAVTGQENALYTLISEYTDGLQSRLAIGRMPDNTWLPKTNIVSLTAKEEENIKNVARLLRVMKGDLALPKLDEASDKWTETIRMVSLKNSDKVMARCRMRDHVITRRMVCCLMLCSVAEKLIRRHGVDTAENMLKSEEGLLEKMMRKEQTPEMMGMVEVIGDYIMSNDLYFFNEKLENAYKKSEERMCGGLRVIRGKNDSIYSRLPMVFTYANLRDEAKRVKGNDLTENAVKQMVKNWKASGLIVPEGNGFRKLNS